MSKNNNSPFKQEMYGPFLEEQATQPVGGKLMNFLDKAATPLGIATSIGSSIFGAIKARKEERRARRKMKN